MTDVDVNELATRLEALLIADGSSGRVKDLTRMHGGASGLTFSLVLEGADGNRELVAKVAPPGLMPIKNRDVLRQARIMRLMAKHDVIPVPHVVAEDDGAPPEVPPVFVMDRVEGDAFEPILDATDSMPAPDEIRARELDTARTLGLLHAASIESLGLAGEPVVTLEDEVARWTRVIDTVDEDLRPGSADVARRLSSSLPAPIAPVLQHGDFRLGNTLALEGRVRAVIDWEIWTIGDPRIDLGWYLMSTHPSKQSPAVREADGMPSDEELVATYQAVSGIEVTDLTWFEAFTQFKAAAITGQIIKHNRRAATPHEVVSTWDPHVPPTFLATAARLLTEMGA